MSGATGAVVGLGVVAAGGAIASSAINKGASEDATTASVNSQREFLDKQLAAQTQNSERAAALLREYADKAEANNAPFRQAQLKAVNGLQAFTDPNNPLYNQQRDISTQAIQRQLAAQGLLRSSAQGEGLQNLELGLSQQRLGVLQSLSGSGANQVSAGIAQQAGQGLSGIYSQLGNGMASSFANAGNNISGALSQNALLQGQYNQQMVAGINNAFQGAAQNYLGSQRQLSFDQLLQLSRAGGGGGGFNYTLPATAGWPTG